MTQTGSSLLKLIQNNNMPILDLLVRESIQNSLDAQDDTDTPYVDVSFITGKFRKEELNKELEGVEEALNSRFIENEYDYIAIKDSNTVGLTGKLHYSEIDDHNYGNLLKLVYEISKPQEIEGAGGSWGLGKTVYFRIGMGLVIYYSRIINEKGEYESRLAASLVEDEMKKDSVIPKYKNQSKRGIAWWGETYGDNENQTIPVTDQKYIEKILNIFGIEKYDSNETGTTIIIPYIDKQYLLDNNQAIYHDGENNEIHPSWQSSIEEYIRIAIQRWYAPRLNNAYYKYNKFLRANINNIWISLDEMEPCFSVIQALYNRSNGVNLNDILSSAETDTKSEKIILRGVLEDTNAGTVSFTRVKRSLLKMNYPDNKPNPFMYINSEILDSDRNKPIICFSRKPGMVVSYEVVGNWVDGIEDSLKDEYIIGVFSLNSTNRLVDVNISLDEYVRRSEMADHTSWGDQSIENSNPRIVKKIQEQLKKKIAKEFFVEEEVDSSRLNSGLGKLFGDLLLPPENFGKKPSGSSEKKNDKTSHVIGKNKRVILTIYDKKTEYHNGYMDLFFNIKSNSDIKMCGFSLSVDSDNGEISLEDWENRLNLNKPFEIEDCYVMKKNKNEDEERITLTKKVYTGCVDDFEMAFIMTKAGSGCGIRISSNVETRIDVDVHIKLLVYRKDIKPAFRLEKFERG